MKQGFYSTELTLISYKGNQGFFKAALSSTHGSVYPSHLKNLTRNEMMKCFVTPNVISKIDNNAPDLNKVQCK